MFRLRDQIRQQQSTINLTRGGFLSFYDCTVKVEDVQALVDQVTHFARKGFLLRRITFEFCRFSTEDGTLEALQQFFASTPSLKSISFVKNVLSNLAMAQALKGANHHKELIVVLPGGNAALAHRHSIVEACPDLESLCLDFKGSSNFGNVDDAMVEALSKMHNLKMLRLDGWTMTNDIFGKLVDGISRVTSLTTLELNRLRGLTSTSLCDILKLGKAADKPHGLQELQISMIPSLFVDEVDNNGGGNNNGGDENSDEERTTTDFQAFFRNLNIRQVSIQESRLDRKVVRALFRGLAQQLPQEPDNNKVSFIGPPTKKAPPQEQTNNTGNIVVFRLKAWSFTDEEFQQLCVSLPQCHVLTKLDLSQGGIDFSTPDRQEQMVQALETNTILQHVDLSYRGQTLNGETHLPLGRCLERNRHLDMVRRVLQQTQPGHSIIERLVVDRLASSWPATPATKSLNVGPLNTKPYTNLNEDADEPRDGRHETESNEEEDVEDDVKLSATPPTETSNEAPPSVHAMYLFLSHRGLGLGR